MVSRTERPCFAEGQMQLKQGKNTSTLSPIYSLPSPSPATPPLAFPPPLPSSIPLKQPLKSYRLHLYSGDFTLCCALVTPANCTCRSHAASQIRNRIPQSMWTGVCKHSWQKEIKNRTAKLNCLVLILSASDHVFHGAFVVPADSPKGFPYKSAKITQRIELWSWNWLLF